jgi:cell division septal protein FtsQ
MRRAPVLTILFACVAGFAAGGIAVELGPGELRPERVGDALRGPRFQLRTVEFTGLTRLEPASMVRIPRGQALIDLDPEAICQRLAAHPRISECRALRLPPDRLWIDVVERVPVARLGQSERGVDAEGVRLPLLADETARLPRLEGKPEWALPLLALAESRGLAVTSVDAQAPSDLRVRVRDVTPVLRMGRDLERALASFDAVRTSDQARSAGEIDLRFEGGAVLRKLDKGGDENGAS